MSVSTSQLLFPQQKGRSQYKVSPLVTMQIISHHERRPDDIKLPKGSGSFKATDFVAGFLFGTKVRSSAIVRVESSCPIPAVAWSTFDDGARAALIHSLADMNEIISLHLELHSTHKLVGIYLSDGVFEPLAISALFDCLASVELKGAASERLVVAKKRRLPVPEMICLIADTQLRNDELSLVAYVREAVGSPLRHWRFSEVRVAYEVRDDWLAVGLHTAISSPPDNESLDAAATLQNDLKDLDTTLSDLLEKVGFAEAYVAAVESGQLPADESIGCQIQEAIDSVPLISAPKFERQMSARIQNLLLLAYLSKLTRSQLNIGDKINQILHKTIPDF